MQAALAEINGLTILEASVEDLRIDRVVTGVVLATGEVVAAKSVVLTTGTFLNGVIHIGERRMPAGRMGDALALGLSKTLYGLGLAMGRLKTGTPPRLDGSTIDWAALEMQPGDEPPVPFSFLTRAITTPQIQCGITRTTAASHKVLTDNLARLPLFLGSGSRVAHDIARRSRTRWCGSRNATAIRISRARGAGRRHGLSERHFDLDAGGSAAHLPQDDPGLERAVMRRRATRSSMITSIHASWRQRFT